MFIWFSLLERSYVLPFLETAVPSETRFYNKTVFDASQENKDLMSFILINHCKPLLSPVSWFAFDSTEPFSLDQELLEGRGNM